VVLHLLGTLGENDVVARNTLEKHKHAGWHQCGTIFGDSSGIEVAETAGDALR
jgi:hypothetical protein